MAAGIPVIATDVGGSGEIIEDGRNGLLIPPRDTQALKRALSSIMGNRTLRLSMVRRGTDTLARFSSQTMVEQTVAALSVAAGMH
jgi:glycosyltransferase involved in cell wall biosynthesis